jgi:N6-adenosine-specific RNA methylase IME4
MELKKYRTILSDPPWLERGGGKIKRGADKHYPLMPTKDIIALSSFVKKITEEDAHLYLWVTNNFLTDGLKVMEAWGFRYITKITWFKEGRMGLGQYFRGVTEDCLFGVKGNVPYKIIDGKRQQGVTGFRAPKGRHSEKPEKMREMIERVSYPPFVELFARPTETNDIFDRENVWEYIGNEIDGTDIRNL